MENRARRRSGADRRRRGGRAYDHARQSSLLAAKAEESRSLAQTVKALKDRIDAIEVARTRDESADLRKVAARDEGGKRRRARPRRRVHATDGAGRPRRPRSERAPRQARRSHRPRIDGPDRRPRDATRQARKEAGRRRRRGRPDAASPRQAAPAAKPDPGRLQRNDRLDRKDRRRRCAVIGSSKSRTAPRSSTAGTARDKWRPAMSCPAPAGCSASNAAATSGSS